LPGPEADQGTVPVPPATVTSPKVSAPSASMAWMIT